MGRWKKPVAVPEAVLNGLGVFVTSAPDVLVMFDTMLAGVAPIS